MAYLFPGMDPFLEHPGLWRGFHASLIATIRELLSPVLPDRYWVDVEETIYLELESGLHDAIGADVAVSTPRDQTVAPATAGVLAPGFVSLEEVVEIPIKVHSLTIRRLPTREVVTAIEVLSPTNKSTDGYGAREYNRKRQEIVASRANLVKIDLLRGGIPLLPSRQLDPHEYVVLVHRAWEHPRLWARGWRLPEPIPAVPIPLLPEDPAPFLDLGQAVRLVYERGRYDRVIGYGQGPDSPVPQEHRDWMARVVAGRTRV